MKIVLGEAKEEYDTDVQMAVTRQLILRVNTEIKPEEAYVVSEITYSQRTGYYYEWFVFCLHIVTFFGAKLQKNRSLVHGFVVECLVAHGNLRVAAGEDHLQDAVGEPAGEHRDCESLAGLRVVIRFAADVGDDRIGRAR